MDRSRLHDRGTALLGAAFLHALVGYALLAGLSDRHPGIVEARLHVFDVREAPPPPSPPKPASDRSSRTEGAASPASIVARPTPVVAPSPAVRIEADPPLLSAPEPMLAPPGLDPDAGASAIDQPGDGAGGTGAGDGAGRSGIGAGGGGATRAVRIAGALDGGADYPRASRRAGVEGSVSVRFTVATDGRVDFCRVIRSTANAEIEATTCRLIQRRFRYRPARDAGGLAVPEIVHRTFEWSLPLRDAQ